MKKLSIIILTGLIGENVYAQDPYAYSTTPQPFPPLSLTLPAATQWSYNVENAGPIIAPGSGTLDISPTSTVVFTSGESVELKPGFSAEPTTGLFHARIDNVDNDMALFNPANVGTELDVEQYEKMEFGVKLPQDVLTAIGNFKAGTGSPQVNPFNPTELVTSVTYRHYPSINSIVPDALYQGFGFYYEEFERTAHAPLQELPITAWAPDNVITNYNIRFRWAPPDLGWWRVEGAISCPSQNYFKTFQFWINCIPPVTDPNNLGYVTRSPNEHYLRLGGQTWMPFGNNIQWPADEINGFGDEFAPFDIPSDRYDHFYDRMVALKNGGANFFRTILWPQSTDIEFEEADNYFSRSHNIANRMYNAWEVDRIIDEARSLNLYIEFTSTLNNQLMNPGPYALFYWDWPDHDTWQHLYDSDDEGFGYSRLAGVNAPVDFLTNTNARDNFKYRLQYMMARWGYARQIAIFQLLSESNNIGTLNHYSPDASGGPHQDANTNSDYPYYDPQVQGELAAWHNEMLHYLKHDLGMKQLLSESYAITPASGDFSYDLTDVDIRDFNSYPDHFHPTYSTQTYDNYITTEFRSANGIRPVMNSETGGTTTTDNCGPTEWILGQWIYPFSGIASGGINWLREDQFVPIAPLYSMIGVVKDFIGSEDFNSGWVPQIAIKPGYNGNDYQVSCNYMLNSGEQRALGVIINRSYNGYVEGCVDPNHSSNHPLAPNDQPQIVHYNDGIGRLNLHLFPITTYTEEFYNFLTGAEIPNTRVDVTTDSHGNLEMQFPDLDVINNINPIVAFKVYPSDGHRLIDAEQEAIPVIDSITIYPNPASNQLKIDIPCTDCHFTYRITSVLGDQAGSGEFNATENVLDISGLANGVYMLYIRDENDLSDFKKSFSIVK